MEANISEEVGARWKKDYEDRFTFLTELFDGRPFRLPPDETGRERISAAMYDSAMVAIDECWKQRSKIEGDKKGVQIRMSAAAEDVVNRWAPWWLSVDDFAPGDTYNANMVCRPLAHAEYRALPPALQPLMRHLCPDEHDTLQQPVLDRAAAAARCAREARERAREDPASVERANSHIRVRIEPSGP